MKLSELKKLAEAAKGWENCNQAWTITDPDYVGIAFVGHIDEDGNKYDIAEINTGQYYADESAIKVATFISAANPQTILSMIALIEKQHSILDSLDFADEDDPEWTEALATYEEMK